MIAANGHTTTEVKAVFLKGSSCLFSRGKQSIIQSMKSQRLQTSQIKVFEMQISTNNYASMRLPCKEPCTTVSHLRDTLLLHCPPVYKLVCLISSSAPSVKHADVLRSETKKKDPQPVPENN